MSSRSKRAGKLAARDAAELGLMSALMVATQFALSFIPNVHLTAVLIVVTAVVFGWSAMYSVLVYVMLEGLMYGFGVWWVSYLYAWPLLCAVAVVLRKNDLPSLLWAAVTGAMVSCSVRCVHCRMFLSVAFRRRCPIGYRAFPLISSIVYRILY